MSLFISAQAAVITVNTTSGGIAADGLCSLREAVANANANGTVYADCGPGSTAVDEIRFGSGLTGGTINLSGGSDIIVNDDVDIIGPGRDNLTIRNSSDRMFYVTGGAYVAFFGMTLADGRATSDHGEGVHGGAVLVDDYSSSVLLDNLIIRNCYAPEDGGGACLVGWDCAVWDSRIINCSAGNDGGGLLGVSFGWDVWRTEVEGCTAGNDGGGTLSAGVAMFNIEASSFINNSAASGNGGGALLGGFGDCVNTTFYGNFAAQGGGIHVDPTVIAGDIYLIHLTTVNNIAANEGGGIHAAGVPILGYSIVAENTSGIWGPDVNGTIGSLNYNLILDQSDATFTGNSTNHIIGSGPLLGPLDYHDGPTRNLVPAPNSPAFDAIPFDTGAAEDQREVSRPQNDAFEIGSVEVYYTHPQKQLLVPVFTLPGLLFSSLGALLLLFCRGRKR